MLRRCREGEDGGKEVGRRREGREGGGGGEVQKVVVGEEVEVEEAGQG